MTFLPSNLMEEISLNSLGASVALTGFYMIATLVLMG